MSRTISINGTDRTSLIRLDSWVFVESANRGEVGLGGFVMDDDDGNLDVPAHKAVTVTESAASPTRLFTGYVADRRISRGKTRTSTARQWDVMVTDLNTLLEDYLLTDEPNRSGRRPEETDFRRVTFLLAHNAMTDPSITDGQVPNTNTVTMNPMDYRSSFASDLLEDCARKAGKNYFLYNWGSGHKLYYDTATATSATTTSSLRISSVLADVDGSTTFAPIGNPTLYKTPLDVYSRIRFVWSGGAVVVQRASTAQTFRQRSISVTNTRINTKPRAQEQANKYLDAAATETTRIENIVIQVPAANVNDIRAGQRLQIKLPHLGYSAFTYARCIRREVRPAQGTNGYSDVDYRITLELADDIKATTFSDGGNKRGRNK